ncbi:hypothetical protein Bbelb_200650 [Branchiostoma belcheri]|nr:hypothetical protein Bbelb_200650 [Branchiostoma belcheri]
MSRLRSRRNRRRGTVKTRREREIRNEREREEKYQKEESAFVASDGCVVGAVLSFKDCAQSSLLNMLQSCDLFARESRIPYRNTVFNHSTGICHTKEYPAKGNDSDVSDSGERTEPATSYICQKNPSKKVLILCDCKAAIENAIGVQQVGAYNTLVHTIRNKLRALSHLGITVQITWCPGHMGISGNEIADNKAKLAANEASSHETHRNTSTREIEQKNKAQHEKSAESPRPPAAASSATSTPAATISSPQLNTSPPGASNGLAAAVRSALKAVYHTDSSSLVRAQDQPVDSSNIGPEEWLYSAAQGA